MIMMIGCICIIMFMIIGAMFIIMAMMMCMLFGRIMGRILPHTHKKSDSIGKLDFQHLIRLHSYVYFYTLYVLDYGQNSTST